MKGVAELSRGRVKPSVGTLYGVLDRLAANGVITVDREEIVNGRRRRYFRITDSGRALVRAEADACTRPPWWSEAASSESLSDDDA